MYRLLAKIDNKVKGTFLENVFNFWKNVMRDYKEVALDVHRSVREKPSKALLYGSGAAVLSCCAATNPDKVSFRGQFLDYVTQVILVHPDRQNPQARAHLKFIEQCYNRNLVRHLNFLIFSFIWIDHHSDGCNTYECSCSYMKLGYGDVSNRIIDFGFLNNWWVLSRKMLDYDVNF